MYMSNTNSVQKKKGSYIMIRKIELYVDENGKITCSDDDFAGVCGENAAVEVCFQISEDLLSSLKVAAKDKPFYYRFEVKDATNKRFVLENNQYESGNTFSLTLTNAFTEHSGRISVGLVFESEDFTLCSLPIDLKIEKFLEGEPNNAAVHSTIVSIFNQAENLLEDLQNTANSANLEMNQNLEQSQAILNECEQRKVAAETAAMSAIDSANSAAQSKNDAQLLLLNKEDISNKETNLMQETLPDHTKYASAKATQEFVNSAVSYLSGEIDNSNRRLDGTKADKTELEATKNELAETKAEIERLKTKDDFQLIEEIVCDGKTKNYYANDLEPLKKLFLILNTPEPLVESLESFSCYANAYSGSSNALAIATPSAKTKLFRLYTERIANGLWKTDMHPFSTASYGTSWNSSYGMSAVDFITNLRIAAGDGETKFLPEGTTIKIYGVKA